MSKLETNYIEQGDCFKLLKNIPDNSIDLVLTDPPYEFRANNFGGGRQELSNRAFKKQLSNENLNRTFETNMLDEFERICKKVNFVIFGTELIMNKIMNWCNERKYNFTITVWNKTNPTPFCNNTYLNNIEFAICVREKGVKFYGDYSTKHKVFTSAVNKKDKTKYGHPTIKPLELIEKYVINHSLKGDIILDPFIGSGTTCVAAYKLDRKYIGFELDEKYFNIACKRLDEVENEY